MLPGYRERAAQCEQDGPDQHRSSMSASPTTFARRSQGLLTRIAPDRRRHKRITVELLGRFMRENKQEHPCRLIDVSAGGAAIRPLSPADIGMGERVVAFFEHIGGIEGTVVHRFEGGFAVKLNATQHKREKLAATLTWLTNRSELGGIDERRHERIAPNSGRQQIHLPDGAVLECQVIDFSLLEPPSGRPHGRHLERKWFLESCVRALSVTTRTASVCSSLKGKTKRR